MGWKRIIILLIYFIHFHIGIKVGKCLEIKFNELKIKDKILRIYFWILVIIGIGLLFVGFIKYCYSYL